MITKIATKDRDEWKALRKKYIGGSDAGACVGMNPYKSAYSLWAEKTGRSPEFEGNLATDVGAYMEDFIAKRFEEETGKKVRRENHSIVNDQYPWAIANYDRLIVGESAGLECKFTDSINLKRYKGGEFPERFYAQCVHYLAVSGKKRWYLAVLIGNKEFKWFCIERDEEEIAALMQAEKEVYDHIQTDTPPEADGSRSTADAIEEIYPESNDSTVDLSILQPDLELYDQATIRIKEMEKIRDECANKIKSFMGVSGTGLSSKFRVSFNTQRRTSYDFKKIAMDHPEIDFSGYQKTTQFRTFKINRIEK